jgi:hypothetical protein
MSTQPSPTDIAAIIERLELRERAYSRLEAADIIGVSESGIDRLIGCGALPAFAPSKRKVTIARSDLARFMWERERRTPLKRPKSADSKPLAPHTDQRRGRAKKLPRVKVASR